MTDVTPFRIDGADPRPRVLVIAEAGVNHDGDVERAHALIDLAKRAGAGIVKFQTFRAESLVTASAPTTPYQAAAGFEGTQSEMLKRLELPASAWAELRAHCGEVGIAFLSTPFDLRSAEMLVQLGVAGIKIGSGDLTNTPFLRRIAAFGLPMVISTGMGSMAEVEDAVAATSQAPSVALLHCVTAYPAPLEQCNLRAIPTLQQAFGVEVGWSDHTTSAMSSIMAVALGATIIEKHITTDRRLPGPDHSASMEEAEFVRFVADLHLAASACGDGIKARAAVEAENATLARRSLRAAHHVQRGAVLGDGDLVAMRPEGGLHPGTPWLGRRVTRSLAPGDAVLAGDLDTDR